MLVKKILLSALPFFLGPAISLLFSILVARRESPEIFGAYAVAIALYSFIVGFSDAGFKNFLLSRSEAVAEGGAGHLYVVTSAISAFLVLLFLLFLILGGYSDATVHLWTAVALEAITLGVLYKGAMFQHQISDELSAFSVSDIFGKLTYGAIKIFSYLIWNNLLFSILISGFFLFLFYTTLTYQTFGKRSVFFRILDTSKHFEAIRFFMRKWRGWGPFALSFLAFYLYFTSNRLIISFLLGEQVVAVFSAAYLLISLGEIPISVIWALYLPKARTSNYSERVNFFLLLMLSFAAALVCFYAILAAYIFKLIFPTSYAESPKLLFGMSFYFLFRYPNLVYEIFFAAGNKYIVFTRLRLLSAFLGVLMNILLIPIYGVWTAVLCMVLCEALITVLCIGSKFNVKTDSH